MSPRQRPHLNTTDFSSIVIVIGKVVAYVASSRMIYGTGGRARRDGDAYRLVLFQVVLGALHFDVFIGCKLRADQIIRSVTGLDALAISRFKLGCPLRVGYFRSADLVQGA